MDEENNTRMEDAYACGEEEEYACGDPKVDVRVGDEYQAEIPSLMISESQRAAYLSNPLASGLETNAIAVGLPVDIMWIDTTKLKDEDDNVDMSESLKSLKTKRNKQKMMMNLEAVPERSSSSAWEDLEVDAFVLALYTFGKNFTQIKQFLESQETGQLLSFYYGKFYNSTKHKIWSNSLKKRKCIQGKKLYSGWRLHQLLSRLLPSIADESLKTKLANFSKSFAEGNTTSLEKYISAVKELVGLRSLVEAVAIGTKEDLTVLTTEPVNSKQWFTVSSSSAAVVPAGLGVYSSLTSAEIIEKLSGGSRLSKARCNDIFWEAVWPRLLARGWHSEQPKDRGKDNIVYLIPGVKKFSRRKLVKQNHYFDSISDIIKKVVSDPELLEFDDEAAAEIRPPPNGGGIVEENQSKQEKRRYLKSPDSCLKFTVVDTTSLASGGKLCAFRELRNPESQSKACQGDNKSSCVGVEKKDGKECKWEKRRMKKLVEEPVRFMIVDTSVQSSGIIRRRRRLPANENLCNPSSSENVTWEENVRSKKRSVRRSESVNNHSLSSFPLPKRRRLSACVRKDIERFGESCVSNLPEEIKTDKSEEAGNRIEILRLKTEPSELCSIHEVGSSEKQQEEEAKQLLCSSKDKFEEKLIQLPSMSGSEKMNSPSTDHGTTQETASIKQEEEGEENQQIKSDPPRRQSTRKRPLTTRALEALESGCYTAKTLKSTPKPIKRERSARIKHSRNRAQGESDNGFLVQETTSSKPLDQIECSEPSFLADKATAASKPVDQTEDSNNVITEFPKRPPILLKLPFKRS
ncbi:hypothetical protein Rs2_43360 [Raphanus sativus]|uniref:Uncharacterized protein LOC108827000 n=1 Tax=Raphanus sativus TaxID=3726 RepID=A0A6J0L7L4_RAPSA|nr:uncharacterized protein LOC108827000 [Raphanus sativus]XP_018455842.1 uncharacterized protein LOC108827000 [Raphanus sativus]XP_018455844.1 uncharacterized protein LOC108827000 [Raphanus sativus]KAJ4878342.1 hypothetical protein Rs2_43360 [Raphanus sativus]